MKIYERIVIDIETGLVEESESFEYNGPVAECKGGGGGGTSTTTTTVDSVYNSRMATLAERQQAMSDEYFKFWEESYKPMEQAQIAANTSLIPAQTANEQKKMELETAQSTAQLGLLPQQTELASAQMGLGMKQTELGMKQADLGIDTAQARQEEIASAKPVVSEYYKQALRGVDVNQRVGQAQADVAQAFKGTDAALARTMGRYGVTAGSDRFEDVQRKKAIEHAKATGAAMTGAKEGAEDENYKRLGDASKYFKGGIA